VLTFLAGAELDPGIFRTKWKEASVVGMVGFASPFLGAAAVAHFLLKWSVPASWLVGVALSTTSVAVVYSVMLEFGLNRTDFGKGILAACFVNDLGTVIALGLIFAPFTMRTLIFVVASVVVFAALPFVTPWFFQKYGGRVSELETKYILFLLFGMGGLAAWAGSEAVLPAYIIGMVLAGTVGKDHILVRRLRTLTFGLLTPFYFIRAGSLVSVPALFATPFVFLALLAAKMLSKMAPLVPTVRAFNHEGHQGLYYALMMSTGLTFGTISALFGLNHKIITEAQYSHLVATVIASAVIPTAIANAWFMPKHLLPRPEAVVRPMSTMVEDAGAGE
jgi:Kef-type K+ transport system membrane component KefB